MPRILGVDIPGNKKVPYALRYIYGIGATSANRIVQQSGIDADKRADDLTGEEITRITGILQEGFAIEGDLRRDIAQNLRRLASIGTYRGIRHRRGLPVRGQRTHTNARTRKGVKRTVGAVRNKAERNAMKKK